jgi:hypothetical protein
MNNKLKLWTTTMKEACSTHAETHGLLSDQQGGFRLLRSKYEALASLIRIIEDAKIYNRNIYIMFANFKGAFIGDDHRIMFQHMLERGMPPLIRLHMRTTLRSLHHQFHYPVCTTPPIDINRGTLEGDTLLPFLFTLFLEPFINWLTVGSRGYILGPEGARPHDHSPTTAYQSHGFADDLSLATCTLGKLHIQLCKPSLFNECTGPDVNPKKCSAIGSGLWHKGDANSKNNIALLEHHLSIVLVHVNNVSTPSPPSPPPQTSKSWGWSSTPPYRSQLTAET